MPTLSFLHVGNTAFRVRFGRITASSCQLRAKASMTQVVKEEHFDVLKEDGTLMGFSKARSLVHREGDWHRSTHIWVLSTQGEVLVQLRSALKDTFPGRWDVSAAGHISAGDDSLTSATRELEEELGISLREDEELEFLTSVKASATGKTDRHGPYVDNEIQDIYVFRPRLTFPIERMVLQSEEVEQVQYWSWKEYQERSLRNDELLVPRSVMYKQKAFPRLAEAVAKSS
ncbi:nudix hydrolase 3 [Gracilaria domingensis]|nr:nudix hydrolase 3 [Gracilaria domingensis]